VVCFGPFCRRLLGVELVSLNGSVNLREASKWVLGLLLLRFGQASLCLLLCRHWADARLSLSVGRALDIDRSRFAIDALVNVGDISVRIVALYMLPRIAVFAKHCVPVVVVVATDAFDGRIVLDFSADSSSVAV
jgi:hypothetical protein